MRLFNSSRKNTFIFLSLIFVLLVSCKKDTKDEIGNLSTDEFIHYRVNGVDYSYEMPADNILANAASENATITMPLSVTGKRLSGSTDVSAIHYSAANIGVGTLQKLEVFATAQTELYPHNATTSSPVFVNITEYGIVGQYISGNFSALITGSAPGNLSYNVNCSFRVKRKA